MAQYKTEFIEYLTGSQPSDWTERWSGSSSSWGIEDEGIGSPSDNVLRHTATLNARRALSWDDIDSDADRDDCEVLAKVRFTSVSSDMIRLYVRGTGSAGSEEAYWFIVHASSPHLRLGKYVSGSATNLATTTQSLSSNTWYWVRLRAEGTDIRAKFWTDGDTEPASWTLTATDSAITAAGWAGVGSFTSNNDQDFDFVSIATNGETAEGPDTGVAAECRATQVPVLVLAEGPGDVRTTQVPVLILHDVAPDVRATQAPVLVLAEFEADTRITQTPILVLADQVECLTKWTQTWTITRTDGQVFAFTSLDKDFVFRGTTHKTCNSLSSTATEMSTAHGSTGSMELNGIISDSSITDEDLFNGLFDGATIEIWSVPWENAGGEIPFRLLAGTLGDVDQGVIDFTAEIITPGATMQQKPLLEVYTPGCRYELGDKRCKVDLDALEVSGSVTGLTIPNSPNSANKRVFIDTSRTEVSGFFEYGEVTWTSGLNTGITSEVKDFNGTTFTLWKSLLHPISSGDTYTAKPGCDKSESTCKTKFSNFINYGGYPHVPGQDRLVATPDAK